MKRLIAVTMVACSVALAPFGAQPKANEAHHQGNDSKAKKSSGAKAQQKKKTPAKPAKSSERELPPAAAISRG